VGKNTFDCDGSLEDYSILTFILNAPIKKIKGKRPGLRELIDFKY